MRCFVIGPIILPKINLLFFPYHNTGGHFVDWSIYWLSGQNKYFNRQAVVPLMSSGLDAKNFHFHRSLVCNGFDDLQKKIDVASQLSLPVINIYIGQFTLAKMIKQMFNVLFEQATESQVKQSQQEIYNDTQKMIQWIQQSPYQLAVFDFNKDDLLNIFYNNRCPSDFRNGQSLDSEKELWDLYIDTFFNEGKNNFDKEIWDLRELLSLTVPLTQKIDYYNMLDRSVPHLYYNTDDLWNDFLQVAPELLNFFNLEIDPVRLAEWKPIYNDWRLRHNQSFSRHFDRIIKAIVANDYMDLSRFNLNFYMEVLIQRELINRYNLNFKTWQLDKFPLNTQDLHKLLEPNIHKL
jgi:hypothetical protein